MTSTVINSSNPFMRFRNNLSNAAQGLSNAAHGALEKAKAVFSKNPASQPPAPSSTPAAAKSTITADNILEKATDLLRELYDQKGTKAAERQWLPDLDPKAQIRLLIRAQQKISPQKDGQVLPVTLDALDKINFRR